MNAAVLQEAPLRSSDRIPPKEFARMIYENHDRESASHGPFVKAFASGKLSREQLKRWGMEWYHYNMWMCPPAVANPNVFRSVSRAAFYTKLDNALGEVGYKKWKAHPYLAADLPLELGASWEEIESYMPLPTTIFYMRSLRGAEPGVAGAGSNMVEMDNQRCSTIVLEACIKHYGISETGRHYFEVHREADIEHTQEYIDLLAETCDTREKQEAAIRRGVQGLRERCVCWNGWMALLQ